MEPKRVVLYRRVSTGKQAESGLGLADQTDLLMAAVEAKGWTVVHEALDAGLSGKSVRKRPGLVEAMTMLDRGDADVLVAAKLDRLSRSVADFATLLEHASRKNWSVVVLDLDVDTTTPAGEFLASVLVSAAQYERRLISQRTAAAHRIRRSRGKRAGQAPILPAKTRRLIKRLHEEGESLRAIAARLTDQGVPTARGGTWSAATIRHVVRSVDLDAQLAAATTPR